MPLSDTVVHALAKRAHDAYRKRLHEAGATGPADAEWADLKPIYRAQNWDQVRRQERWLLGEGMVIVDVDDVRPAIAQEDLEAQIEQFGVAEHRRWMDVLVAQGWTQGPRNNDAKTHPCLVPWTELPDVERDKDKAPLRELIGHLEAEGQKLVREK